ARGRFCMLGAMQYAQQKLNLTFSAGAGAAIMEAIKQHNDGLFQPIEAFNDTQKSFRSIKRVLEAAKTVTPSDYSTAVMKAKETFDGPNNAAYIEIVISAYREARAKQRAERSKAVKAVAAKLAAELAGSVKMQA